MTHEELVERDAELIAEHGFIVQGVGAADDGDHVHWAYTVGLVDIAEHPELIVVGVDARFAMRLVHFFAQWILDGDRLEIGDEIHIEGEGIARVGAVHDVQYELSTFSTWHRLKRFGAVEADRLEAVQIVLPSGMFCKAHAHRQPLLDDSRTRIGLPLHRPNRAERRRRKRSA